MPTANQIRDTLIQEADSWLRAGSLEDLDNMLRHKLTLAELGVPPERREAIELARLSAQAMAMQNAFLKDVRRAVAGMGSVADEPMADVTRPTGECQESHL